MMIKRKMVGKQKMLNMMRKKVRNGKKMKMVRCILLEKHLDLVAKEILMELKIALRDLVTLLEL